MQIDLYKNSKIPIQHKKKYFLGQIFKLFFCSILNLNWPKTSIFANYRKNPSKWLIGTTKMIQKWAPFAFPCFSVKVLKKRIIVLWTGLVGIMQQPNMLFVCACSRTTYSVHQFQSAVYYTSRQILKLPFEILWTNPNCPNVPLGPNMSI